MKCILCTFLKIKKRKKKKEEDWRNKLRNCMTSKRTHTCQRRCNRQAQHEFILSGERRFDLFGFDTVFEFISSPFFFFGSVVCLYKWTTISEQMEAAVVTSTLDLLWTSASRIEFAVLCRRWTSRPQFRFLLFSFLRSVSVDIDI